MERGARPPHDTGQSFQVRETVFPDGQKQRLWSQASGVQTLILPLTSCMNLDKLPSLSVLSAVAVVMVPDSVVLVLSLGRQMLRNR